MTETSGSFWCAVDAAGSQRVSSFFFVFFFSVVTAQTGEATNESAADRG